MQSLRTQMRLVTNAITIAVIVLAAVFLLGARVQPAYAADGDTITVEVSGLYGQTEARNMLDMVNDFRTGQYIDGGQNAPWAYGRDGSVETAPYANLGELQYDYELEKVAMQRAMETVLQFSHTRPTYANDSYSQSFSEPYPAGYTTVGENLAVGYGGNNRTAKQAFDSWCETNYSYSGQGHRRSMLSATFNRIGIAHVVIHWSGELSEGDRPYNYSTDVDYWVQEFGYRTDSFGLTQTPAVNESQTKSVEVLKANVEKTSIDSAVSEVDVTYGSSSSIDDVVTSMRLAGTWPDKFTLKWDDELLSIGAYLVPVIGEYTLASADPSIVSVSGHNITASKVGTTTITVRSSVDSSVTDTINVTVKQKSISDATVQLPADRYTFNGQAQSPTPTVTLDGRQLTAGDYTVGYDNNTNAGTATVTVTGVGNYKDSVSTTFTIERKDIADNDVVAASIPSVTYNASEQTPNVSLSFGSLTLTKPTDYSVAYENNVNAGTARAVVTGLGNYQGTKSLTFTIEPKQIDDSMVSLESADLVYSGSAQAPRVSVVDSTLEAGAPATLEQGRDYTVSSDEAVNRGTYSLRVEGQGNYSGSVDKTFSISPKPLNAGMIAFDNDSFVYNGATQKPQVSVKDGEIELALTQDYTLVNEGGVSAGDHPVEIRAVEGGNYSGSASKQFAIAPKSISSNDVRVTVAEATYSGSTVAPQVTIVDAIGELGTGDYELSFEAPCIDAGDHEITIAGKGNYTGSKTATLVIKPKQLEDSMVTLAGVSFYYTGSKQAPDVTVADGDALSQGDYDVAIDEAVNCGNYMVTVSGKRNYAGSVQKQFEIVKSAVKVKADKDVEQAAAFTYGQKLSQLSVNNAEFVSATTGEDVSGSFSFDDADAVLDAGSHNVGWTFVPDDENYMPLAGALTVTVSKAVPTIEAQPSLDPFAYHPSKKISEYTIKGGTVSVSGEWKWADADAVPAVPGGSYECVFVPDDSNNYESVSANVAVSVSKAAPSIATLSAAGITYGQTLGDAVLTGSARYSESDETPVGGSFAWIDESLKPVVADSESTSYSVRFTPDDGDNYESVDTKITLEVEKADRPATWPSEAYDVDYDTEKLSGVVLPEGWEFAQSDLETALEPGVAAVFTATYAADDAGNYKNETAEVSVTRSACDHEWDDGVVTTEPTCVEEGVMTFTCKRCKETKTEPIPVTNEHVWDEGVVTTEPTCEEAGVRSFVCKLDASHTKTESVPALGHDWGAWTVVKEASATEIGLKERTCARCGETEQASIPKLDLAPVQQDTLPGAISGEISPDNPVAAAAVEKQIMGLKSDSDPAGSTFSLLQAKGVAKSKTAAKLSWKKVAGATGYVIYGNKCGKANKYQKIATVKGTSYTQKKLKKGTYYKYLVVAVKGNAALATSKTIHVATKGGKVGNAKSVKTKAKASSSLKKGKKLKLGAKAVPQSKKLKVKKHRAIAYDTSDPTIATVNKKGVVTAKKAGKCTVYAYAQNGVFKAVKITVK